MSSTIAAISTPAGVGGISIVRISGDNSLEVVKQIFKPKKNKNFESHNIYYGFILDPKTHETIDEVLVSYMKAPNTYTKEDIVEINCHGGNMCAARVLEIVLTSGIKMAEPGEFTKRAYLNGRIDLTQAEAVIDIINSKTQAARKYALKQIEGSLSKKVTALKDRLLKLMATIEVELDYPDEDIEHLSNDMLMKQISEMKFETEKILQTYNKGKIIKDGIKTVILGKANVGKSTLLNLFLDEERAIVTNIPGTTRDTIEEQINLDGIVLKLIDTAGIRDTSDEVEKIGIEKTKRALKEAEIVLLVFNNAEEISKEDFEILELCKDKNKIIILNKTDLEPKFDKSVLCNFYDENNVVEMSLINKNGTEKLINAIKGIFKKGSINFDDDDSIIINVRHKNSLKNSVRSLENALNTIECNMPEDLVSIDLQDAYSYFGEVTGDTLKDDLIDKIFAEFCLGK